MRFTPSTPPQLSCDDNGEVMCFDTKKRGEVVSRFTVHDNICASVQWVPSRTAEVVSGGSLTLID